MTNRYMKRYSTWIIIREMKSKTTIKYYLVPVRMAVIKKIRDHNCCQGCGETESLCIVGVNVNCKVFMKNSTALSKRNKNRATIWSSYISRYVSEGNEMTIWKRYLHPYVHCVIIYKTQDIGAAQVFIHGRMDKCAHTHTHTQECYSAINKEGKHAFCNNMDRPWEHYAIWNK